jgi:type I restriction enzyme, S subunit
MTEWPLVRLGDLAAGEKSAISKPYGSAIIRDDYRDAGVPVVRGVNLARGRFYDDEFVFISEDLADRMPGARLQPGDLVFTHRGSVGQISMIPRAPRFHRYTLSTSQVKARLDPTRAIPEFFYYWFLSPAGRHSILQSISTVGVPGLARPVETIKSLSVPLPPLDEQRRIAGVLGALDDLIDTNRRIADGCTALWRVILSDALADASESTPLSELADFVNGKNFTKGASGRGRPVIRTPEVRRGPEAGTVRSDVDAVDANIAREGDTLFVWSGSLTVGRWMWEEGLVNQHVFKVVSKQDVPAWLVFALIEHQMPWFLSLAADKATTMGHIKREHLDAAVPVPLPKEIKRLGPSVEPLWNEALQCGIAAQQLAHTRDELLPLLLAGRVRVGDGAA